MNNLHITLRAGCLVKLSSICLLQSTFIYSLKTCPQTYLTMLANCAIYTYTMYSLSQLSMPVNIPTTLIN